MRTEISNRLLADRLTPDSLVSHYWLIPFLMPVEWGKLNNFAHYYPALTSWHTGTNITHFR